VRICEFDAVQKERHVGGCALKKKKKEGKAINDKVQSAVDKMAQMKNKGGGKKRQ